MLWESSSGKVAAVEGSSKYWVILRLDQKKVFSKLGVLAIIDLEMLKVKTAAKNDFSWRITILRTTTVTPSKFWVTGLTLRETFSKFGMPDLKGSFEFYISKIKKSCELQILKSEYQWNDACLREKCRSYLKDKKVTDHYQQTFLILNIFVAAFLKFLGKFLGKFLKAQFLGTSYF